MMASSKKGVCKDDESTCMGENWVPSSGAYWMVEAEEARRMTDESGKSGRGCGHSVDSQQKRHWLKGTPSKSFKEVETFPVFFLNSRAHTECRPLQGRCT